MPIMAERRASRASGAGIEGPRERARLGSTAGASARKEKSPGAERPGFVCIARGELERDARAEPHDARVHDLAHLVERRAS